MSLVNIDAHSVTDINPGSRLTNDGRFISLELDMDDRQKLDAVRELLGTFTDRAVCDFLITDYADLVQEKT